LVISVLLQKKNYHRGTEGTENTEKRRKELPQIPQILGLHRFRSEEGSLPICGILFSV